MREIGIPKYGYYSEGVCDFYATSKVRYNYTDRNINDLKEHSINMAVDISL